MGDDTEPKGEVTTPEAKEQTPAQTFTRDQVDAAIAKAKNDALSDVGRMRKALEESNRIADAALKRAKEVEDENYRRQEEVYRDDPDELSRMRKRRQDAEREKMLSERETKIKTQLNKVLQVNASALSKQYNVSEDVLLKYAGDDAESMEELAKTFGERKGDFRRMKEAPDDGKTRGGGSTLTKEDVAKMSPEEQHRRQKEIAAIPF